MFVGYCIYRMILCHKIITAALQTAIPHSITNHRTHSSVSITDSPRTCTVHCYARLMRSSKQYFNVTYIIVFFLNHEYAFFRGLSESEATAFRECYGRPGELRAYLKDVPFICMSATATEAVVTSVTSSLRLLSPNIIRVQVNKPNIW